MMSLELNLNTLFQAIILFLIYLGVIGIFAMKDQLAKMNGTVQSLNTWKGEHIKLDDERHGAAEKNWTGLWEAIENIRKMCFKRGIKDE